MFVNNERVHFLNINHSFHLYITYYYNKTIIIVNFGGPLTPEAEFTSVMTVNPVGHIASSHPL